MRARTPALARGTVRRIATGLLLAALLASAGCSSIAGPGTTSPGAGGSPSNQAASPGNAAATNGSGTTRLSTNGTSAYTQLYRETIDSVVTVRVVGGSGQGGTGSGFLYDGQGHVVTNAHVVQGARQVEVRFQRGGQWRTARVVGTDVYTDLAVLDVASVPNGTEPLPVARESPVPGQRVAALGSPYGLAGSITSGIISGVNRSMPSGQGFSIPDTIQTDAPINPGNSGGPLVSMNGTVVGVNRAKEGDNIGFAISADIVRQVVPELVAEGEYRHSYLGVRTVPVTGAVAAANDLPRASGVYVVDTVRGSPAAGALQSASGTAQVDGTTVPVGGDAIVAIEGTSIDSQQELSNYLVLHTRPGETVPVTVIRDGERTTVEVTLDERPVPTAARRSRR